MTKTKFLSLAALLLLLWPVTVIAQETSNSLTVATVTRAPFSTPDASGGHTGFSVDLLNAAAEELGLQITYDRYDSFAGMMNAVQSGAADAAIANISITAERERMMDFTQPIFDGGVQVMLHNDATGSGIATVLLTRDVGLLVLAAVALLLIGGMIMWVFERRHQSYFDHSAKDAIFPAFWWALNLVVNGGFEERMPQSRPGRLLGVLMVIGSLFIVSIFVAQITAALTINAIQENIDNLSDLEGRPIGTIEGSTTASFLNDRGLVHSAYPGLDPLLAAFEAREIDAVVFDGPILAYYALNDGAGKTRLLDRIYRPEKYGMAFPTGSPFREPIDQAFLTLRENDTYRDLLVKWFGAAYAAR